MIHLPILYDKDFKIVGTLHPEGMSVVKQALSLNSTTFELPYDEAPVMGQWVRVYTSNGDEGFFRVVQVQKSIGQGDRCTVYAEHGICTLNDDFIPEKADVKGVKVKNQLKNILGKQTLKRWQLGKCEINDSQTYSLQKATVFEAFLALVKAYGQDYMLTYDFSTNPWTVNVVAVETSPSCECRLSRNLQSVKIVTDRTDMANLLYLTGYKDAKGKEISPPKVIKDSESIKQWGTVAVEYTDGYAADNATLEKNAKIYLKQSKNPLVSVQIDAVQLADITGEKLDSFGCGRMCRIAIPDYLTTQNEVIVGVAYADVYGDPTKVTLTMANKLQDASTGLAKLEKSTSSGKRGTGSKTDNEDILASRFFDATQDITFSIWGDKDPDSGERPIMTQLKLTRDDITAMSKKITLMSSGAYLNIEGDTVTIAGKTLDIQARIKSIIADTVTADFISGKLSSLENVIVKGTLGTNDLSVNNNMKIWNNCTVTFKGYTVSWQTETFMTSPQSSKTVHFLGR